MLTVVSRERWRYVAGKGGLLSLFLWQVFALTTYPPPLHFCCVVAQWCRCVMTPGGALPQRHTQRIKTLCDLAAPARQVTLPQLPLCTRLQFWLTSAQRSGSHALRVRTSHTPGLTLPVAHCAPERLPPACLATANRWRWDNPVGVQLPYLSNEV